MAVVYNGSTVSLYIDGVLQKTTPLSGKSLTEYNRNLTNEHYKYSILQMDLK